MPQLCKLQPGDPFLYSSTWISEEELSELGGMRRERSRQTYQRAFPVICFRDQQEISRSVQKPLGVPQSSIAQTAYGHPSKPEVLSHTSPPTHSADSSVCVFPSAALRDSSWKRNHKRELQHLLLQYIFKRFPIARPNFKKLNINS